MMNSAGAVTDAYRDVLELVQHLKATHQPGDLYRGQNRDYPVMAPSFYRPFVTDLGKGNRIAEISETKFQQAQVDSRRSRMQFNIMNKLIGDFGVGLGNVIAQQYGVSSECIDVTESIEVAAYFATRKYPSYTHISDGNTGVIYRFRTIGTDQGRGPLSLHDLSSHFEAGRSETGFYDFFVHDGEPADRVFDRDKWWLSQPGDEAVVWTLRFATSWSELREIINREKWWKLPFHRPPYLGLNIRRPFDWALTRFLGQMGGLIRPRHYWRASVPKRFTLAAKGREAFELGMRGMTGPMFDPDANDNGRWPLVIPSAAVKREFIGVENLRADSNCQVFLFEHGTSRITGFYRRKLWPEPSEDPLYGALWQLGASQSFQAYAWNEFPAIDDVAEGLLDRGYRLDAEEPSNGRAVADLMRCQAEDAAENIAFGTPAARDYLYKMTAEMFGENFRAAGLSAIRGLRLAPDNPDLLQGLSQCFEKLQKPGWAERTLSRALTIDPNHPWLLYRQAMILTRRAQIEEASDLLDRAIQLYNAGTFEFSDFFFLELRQILAWVIGDFPNANRVSNLMTNKGYQMFEVVGQVRYLLRNHPQLVDLMQKGFACSDDPAAKFLCEFALEDLSPALGDS